MNEAHPAPRLASPAEKAAIRVPEELPTGCAGRHGAEAAGRKVLRDRGKEGAEGGTYFEWKSSGTKMFHQDFLLYLS